MRIESNTFDTRKSSVMYQTQSLRHLIFHQKFMAKIGALVNVPNYPNSSQVNNMAEIIQIKNV